MAEHPTNSDMIDALNMVCEYAESNLPKGWMIQLTMTSDESYLELTDSDSVVHEVEVDGWESAVVAMCEYSKERTNG